MFTINTGTYPTLYENVPAGTTDGARVNLGAPTTGTGTADGGDTIMTTSNVLSMTTRTRRTSAASADASAGWSSSTFVTAFWRGNAAGFGGFAARFRFGLSQWAAGQKAFIGMRANASDIGTTDPSALVDCLGVGVDPGDTTWSIFHNDGSGSASKIPLGISVNTAHLMELWIEAPSNGSDLRWIVYDRETGFKRSGIVLSNMPSSTTFLFPHTWSNTDDVATAVRIDLVDWTIGTASPSWDTSGDLVIGAYDNLFLNLPGGVAATGARAAGGGFPSTQIHGASGATQPSLTSSTLLSSTPRTRQQSTTGANNTASTRAGAAYHYRGDVAGRGGFSLTIRFAIAQFVSGFRSFVGFRALGTDIGTAEPDSLVSIIGMGFRSDQTQWRIFHNDASGTATAIALGSNFDVTNDHFLELRLVALSNASSVAYRVRNLTTGNVASGTLSTDLPASNAFLAYHIHTNTAAVAGTPVILETADIRAQHPVPAIAA